MKSKCPNRDLGSSPGRPTLSLARCNHDHHCIPQPLGSSPGSFKTEGGGVSLFYKRSRAAYEFRIIFRDSVDKDALGAKLRQHLLTKKHSLAKQFTYSEVARLKWKSNQERIKNSLGSQGLGLTSCLSTLSYSKKDFNSEAKPLQNIALTALASFQTVADEVADSTRSKEIRDANSETLKQCCLPEELVLIGMLADYHTTVSWLRLQADVDLADVALFPRRIRETCDI